VVQCCACAHIFSIVRQDIDFEQLYSSGKYTISDTRGTLFDRILSNDDRLIFLQLYQLGIAPEKLLDFGCGKGQFLHRAAKQGWEVKGIETAKKRAEFGITEYGLDISTREYEAGRVEDGPFDVITLFHVLEHLPAPKELLRELVDNNLAQNGYLVIEVPLLESLQSRVAGKRWMHLDPPLHLSHFSQKVLLELLGDLGLEAKKYGYLSLHLGILGMVQSIMNLFGYSKNLIDELKFRRTRRLILSIVLALPLASLLELIAVVFKRGGIIRIYCSRSKGS